MKIKFAVAITPQGNYKVYGNNKLEDEEVKAIAGDCLPEDTDIRWIEVEHYNPQKDRDWSAYMEIRA